MRQVRLYSLSLAQPPADVRKVRELCDELIGPLDALDAAVAQHSAGKCVAGGGGGVFGGRGGGGGDGGVFGGIGGAAAAAAEGAWSPMVAGVRKRDLLRTTVLPALSSNRQLQRLLSEYLEMLQGLPSV